MAEAIAFSEREQQVIEQLLLGKSNKQIALALGLSVRAVEFHLSNIYSKLGVSSRTEAALKLSQIRLRESTSLETEKLHDNAGTSISTRRIPMNKSFSKIVLLVLILIICMIAMVLMAKEREPVEAQLSTPTIVATNMAIISPTETSIPTIAPKDHILEQIRQLATDYEQQVQAEKQNGDVQYSKDPDTGEEIFLFQNESYERIWKLWLDTSQQIYGLTNLYTQLYRDEINPTPFPTPLSPEGNQTYLNQLYNAAPDYCPADIPAMQDATVAIYDPDDGKYHPMLVDEEFARCSIYGMMIEEFRTAPMLAKVNQEADMALIRQIMGNADLKLKFQSISDVPNAAGRNAALYTDETGTKYYVDVDRARLMMIEPNIPGHPDISPADAKSMDELRGVARQFAFTNSPRLVELESLLLYEENCKVSICFFRWDYRNKDWTGTDWAMMAPFLQVGVLTNGQIVTYINTLDLFE